MDLAVQTLESPSTLVQVNHAAQDLGARSIPAVASHVVHRAQEALSILVLASRAARGLNLPRAPALVNHAAPSLASPSTRVRASHVAPNLGPPSTPVGENHAVRGSTLLLKT